MLITIIEDFWDKIIEIFTTKTDYFNIKLKYSEILTLYVRNNYFKIKNIISDNLNIIYRNCNKIFNYKINLHQHL